MAHPYPPISKKQESGRLWRHICLWSPHHPSHDDAVLTQPRTSVQHTCYVEERDVPVASSSWSNLRRKALRHHTSQKKDRKRESQPRAEEWVKIWAFSDYNRDRAAGTTAAVAGPVVANDSMTRQSRTMSIKRKPVPVYDVSLDHDQENLPTNREATDNIRGRRRIEAAGGDLVHRRVRPRPSQDSLAPYSRRRESVAVDLDPVSEVMAAERLQGWGWTATELGDMLHQPRPVRDHSRRSRAH